MSNTTTNKTAGCRRRGCLGTTGWNTSTGDDCKCAAGKALKARKALDARKLNADSGCQGDHRYCYSTSMHSCKCSKCGRSAFTD